MSATKSTQTTTRPDGVTETRTSTLAASFAVAVAERDGSGWSVARWSKSRALAEKFAASVTLGYPTAILPVSTAE